MVLDRLVEYLAPYNKHMDEIIYLAWMLGLDEFRSKTGWKKLGDKFFNHFRQEILDWYGFDRVDPRSEKIPVADEEFLIDLLGQMAACKYFGEVSYEFIAARFYDCFRLKKAQSSFCKDLKAPVSDYSDCIVRFLKEIKRIKTEKQGK